MCKLWKLNSTKDYLHDQCKKSVGLLWTCWFWWASGLRHTPRKHTITHLIPGGSLSQSTCCLTYSNKVLTLHKQSYKHNRISAALISLGTDQIRPKDGTETDQFWTWKFKWYKTYCVHLRHGWSNIITFVIHSQGDGIIYQAAVSSESQFVVISQPYRTD